MIPPITHKIFRYLHFSETCQGCSRTFSALRHKKFSMKSCDTPIMDKIFDTRIFLKPWWDAHKIFRHCETESFDGNTWYPLLCMNYFDYPKLLKIEGMPTTFFGTVWPKIFDRKTWYPLLYINFSDTSIFLKHGRDAHKSFRYCETIFFRRKMWYVPFFQPKNLSETRSFLKNSRNPLQKFSAMWDKHFSAENCDTQTMHKVVW